MNDKFPYIAVLYFLPALSFVLYPLTRLLRPNFFFSFLGRIEWLFILTRDIFLSPIIFIFGIYLAVQRFRGLNDLQMWMLPLFAAPIVVSACAYLLRRKRIRGFLVFISRWRVIDADEFFRIYYSIVSGFAGLLPKDLKKGLELPIDYTKGKSSLTFRPYLAGLANTATLARLVIKAAKWKDREFARTIGDVVSSVWGFRVLKLARAKLDIEGIDYLTELRGRTIFVSSHKSFLDFAIIPLAIGIANIDRAKPFRARYIAARDHFYDNKFLHSVIGLGRALEAVGCVFVDRRSKKARPTAAAEEAVSAIVNEGVDIVIFPQGTRAYGNMGKNGFRLDAGYYTAGTPEKLMEPRGHMKKGAAYIAVDSSEHLSHKREPLNVAPIGLINTGRICPRNSWKIMTGVALKIRFGTPMTLVREDHSRLAINVGGKYMYSGYRTEMVEEIYVKIDELLKGVLNINADLKKRLIIDIRSLMKEDEIDSFLEAIDAWKIDQDLIFSVIDCIYACKQDFWRPFLRRLSQLVADTSTPKEELIAFKKVVINEMVKP